MFFLHVFVYAKEMIPSVIRKKLIFTSRQREQLLIRVSKYIGGKVYKNIRSISNC